MSASASDRGGLVPFSRNRARNIGTRTAPTADLVPKFASRRGDTHDGGFTLVELAIAMSLVVVVGAMASLVLFGVRSVSSSVAWRAEANTEIRQLIDQTFADLAAARPLAQCQALANDGTCAKITESRLDPTDPSSTPSVLLSAVGNEVCYRSQRRDPVVAGDSNVTPLYWKVCLGIDSAGALTLAATPPTSTSTYDNVAFDSAATKQRTLGKVDTTLGGPFFTYVSLRGATMTSADLGGGADPAALANVAKVQLQIRLSYFERTKRTRTRALTYTAALRSARYEQERWWSGDKDATK